MSDKLLLTGKHHAVQKRLQIFNGHICNFINIFICYCHCKRFLFQPLPLTCTAGGDPHKGFILLLHGIRTCFPVSLLHVFNKSRESHVVNALSSLSLIINLHRAPLCSIDDHIFDLVRIILKRGIQAELIFLCKRVQNRSCKASLICAGLPAHHSNRPFGNAERHIGDHKINIKFHLISKTGTLWAGSEGIIEGKASRLDFVHTDPAVRAGKALAEIHHIPVHRIYDQKSVRQLQNRFHRICKTLLDSRLYDQPVHNDLNIMLDILIQLDFLRKLVNASVDLYTHIAAFFRMLQKLYVRALSSSYNRGKKLDLRPFRKPHDLIHHLIYCLLTDFPSAFWTVGNSHSCIEKTKIVVNLRNRPYCGTRISVCRFLVNGNGRRKTFYTLHVRLLHLSQELPGIGGKGLHIASLSLCVNSIKSKRGFAGTAQSCKNYKLVPWNIHT